MTPIQTHNIAVFLASLRAVQAARLEQKAHEKQCSERWGSGDEQEKCDHPCHDRSGYMVIGEPGDVRDMIAILESHPEAAKP